MSPEEKDMFEQACTAIERVALAFKGYSEIFAKAAREFGELARIMEDFPDLDNDTEEDDAEDPDGIRT